MIGHEESFKKKIFSGTSRRNREVFSCIHPYDCNNRFCVRIFSGPMGSMLTAYNNSFQKYNIEDGKFETEEKIYKNQQEDIEKKGVTLYEEFLCRKSIA